MPKVIAAFARSLVRAAGFTLEHDGTVRSGETIVYRCGAGNGDHIDAEAFYGLLEWITHRQPRRLTLVEAYANTLQVDELGILGLALKTAPTLHASLKRLERYHRLLTDTAIYKLVEGAGQSRLVLDQTTPDDASTALRSECALGGVARKTACFAQQALELTAVTFRHHCVGDPQDYKAFFGCPVRFGCDEDAIIFPEQTLRLPNRLGDAAVSDFLTQHLDRELDAFAPQDQVRADALRRLSTALSTGVPQAAEIAAQMGMSERTFFRRLADEGTSFRDLVREAQASLARDLLTHSDFSIAEVAFLTGFAEQSTFGRAFKRWVGQAPAQFRMSRSDQRRPTRSAILAGTAQRLAGRADTMASPAV
ncbi:AraC family transcriptional regulator ligand-binding domain-containing protein [Hoeflea sp.]|uniref:AraC family transcriptional regulator ligand-binding domain-containing protein n=1 Tax=Hoeflea sp. TaxID=1940281 RepID=UPI003BB05634